MNDARLFTVVGCLFSRATYFVNGLKHEVWGNYFYESTLVSSLQSAIHVTIEFPLIFGETNFEEVPKIHEICKICSPQKKVPYGSCYCQSIGRANNILLHILHKAWLTWCNTTTISLQYMLWLLYHRSCNASAFLNALVKKPRITRRLCLAM